MDDLAERFWEKVDRRGPDECWGWKAFADPYGRIKLGDRMLGAHRVSYRLAFGDPGDLHVLHRCDNPVCVNPKHLYTGTPSDNLADAYNRNRREPTRKLTEGDVEEIRDRYEVEDITQRELAGEYGVCETTVHNIVNRNTWTHV